MNIKKIYKKLLNQWVVKVICLVAAVLLYFFHQISQVESKSISVDLSVNSDGQMIPISSYPKHVRITVRSTPQNLLQVTEEGISAVLDVSHYAVRGEYKVPVFIDLSPELLLLDPLEMHASPDSISLQLDERTFSYINIQPSISGMVAHGYERGIVTVSPDALKVSGARSIVENMEHLLTDEVSITGHTASFTKMVHISKNNNALISFNESEDILVFVTITPVRTSRHYTGIRVYCFNLQSGLKLSKNAPTVSFTVDGNQLAMEGLSVSEYTVRADCSFIEKPGEYELPLIFMLPPSVSASDKSSETVKVIIEADEKSSAEAQ